MYHCRLFLFYKMISISPVLLCTRVHSTYLPKPYILDQHWFGPRLGGVPILVGSFFPKREFLVSISMLKCFLVGSLCMCLSSISSKFYTLHYWFWYLISSSKTCGSNFTN
jgi:hypothetical protein